MILEEIRLQNFGVFAGKHVASLAPPSKEQPIVLFGGLNGAGKTTMLEAIQLALYGRHAPFLQTARGFESYVGRYFHRRRAPSEGASVGLTFIANEDGAQRRYEVDRSWYRRNGRIDERLEVRINGKDDSVLCETWLEQAERFIPARLAPLFFFDGERIEQLADPEHSSAVLRTAIQGLLGVDLIEQLKVDLQALAQRKRKQIKSVAEQAEIEALEKELDARRTKLRDLKQQRAQIQNQHDRAAKALRDLEDAFDSRGGRLAEQRRILQRQRDEVQVRLQLVRDRLIEIAYGALPMAMCQELLADVAVRSDQESAIERGRLRAEVAADRDIRLLKHLHRQKIEATVIRVVDEFLKKDRVRMGEGCPDALYLGLSSAEQVQITDLVTAGLTQEQSTAAALCSHASELELALDELDRKLAAAPDDGALTELLGRVKDARDAVSAAERELASLDQHIKEGEVAVADIGRKLDTALRANQESVLDNRDIERHLLHSERVQGALESFRAALLAKHLRSLREIILDGYVQLLHKRSLLTTIEIEPETCALCLYDRSGQRIPAERLSAGERQLLAVAILWGLARASGRPLPTVIDTPLGRLDAAHRGNLVEHYFPCASHQVLLLSTDEEIDQRFYESLGARVGRAYRLTYSDATESSSIEPGYFW